MDEDFIFQVTEEELAQFPEEEGIEKEQKEGSKSPIEPVQKVGEETTLQKEKANIPSLLDLRLPRLYATSRKWPVYWTGPKTGLQKLDRKEKTMQMIH